MERERRFEHERSGGSGNGSPGGDGLDQQRGEINDLLRAADRAFDAIDNLHAQQYLEQNMQTGGQ